MILGLRTSRLRTSELGTSGLGTFVSKSWRPHLPSLSVLSPKSQKTFTLLLLLLLAGCRENTTPTTATDSSILATVNGHAITQSDFDFESALRPTMSSDEILNELITRKAMRIRAEASGIADTPALRRELEDRVIAEWLETTYKKELAAITITEDELRAAYENRRDKLVTNPAQTRFAILHRKGRNTAELTDALNDAVALFEADRDAATNNGRLPGFGKIASEHSEDTISRFRGGDIGWVGEGTLSRVPEEILAAGRALETGKISEPPVAGDGVYVVMKTEEREPSHLGYNESVTYLRSRLLSEKRAAIEARFKENLLDGLKVERTGRLRTSDPGLPKKQAPAVPPSPPSLPSAVPQSQVPSPETTFTKGTPS